MAKRRRKKADIYPTYTPAAEAMVSQAKRLRKATGRYRYGGAQVTLYTYRLTDGRVVRDEIQCALTTAGVSELFLHLVDTATGEVLPESRWSLKPGQAAS